MIFEHAPSNDDLSPRFVSQGGRWEVGIHRMLFGFRVQLGMVDDQFYQLDYCAGPDLESRNELLRLVMLILLHTPEEATGDEVSSLFPTCRRKPVMLDPCWAELQRRAMTAMRPSSVPVGT